MRGAPVSGAGIKYPYLWLSLILFFLTAIGIFSSRAQSLFLADAEKIAEIKPPNPLPENPVYSPLARSVHFRNAASSPEKPVPTDRLTPLKPGFFWNGWSETEWWIPKDQDLSPEPHWLREGDTPGYAKRLSYQDLFPELQDRDIDPQAIMSNFITMGVADLLDDLSEQEVEDVAEQDTPKINPFERALRDTVEESEEASDGGEETVEKAEEAINESVETSSDTESEPEKVEENTESDPANSEENSNTNDAIGGGGAPIVVKLLFIGSFDGQPLATASGTMQQDLLRQSLSSTIFVELEESGKLFLDLDVVMRDHNNQESAAFGDLDRDGFIDVVVTNQTTHKAHILKGDGKGNYEPTAEIFGGLGPSAAAISDFNSDGLPDIAVALQISKRIVVDGKGLRKFIHLPTSPVAEEFSSMIPYDYDCDGLMDLLLSNYKDQTTSIYLNQGGGLFAASDSLALQTFPYLQSRIDLDADGIEDRVYIQNLGDNISVVMIDGRNGFISNLGNMTLDSSLYFVLGDFNLDGMVDIALAHRKF